MRPVAALLNLDGRSGKVPLPHSISGRDILSGRDLELEGSVNLTGEPLLVELEGR
jgi:hypothetical protein